MWLIRGSWLLVGWLLATSAASTSGAPCSSSGFHFFPPGTSNVPEAWTRRNQTAAGNGCDDRLLPIAIYGSPKPLLHFTLQHTLLRVGAVVPAGALPLSQLSRRRLLSEPDTAWRVSVPARFTFSVTANGRPWYVSPHSFEEGEPAAVDFNANVTEDRRDIFDPAVFKHGINTIVITASIIPNSGNITDGSVHVTMPEEEVSMSSGPIDFYFFMNARPAATVSFATCTPDLAISLSDASPSPVLLDGYRLTEVPGANRTAFFLPVWYVYGSYVQGLDGSTDQITDNSEGNAKAFGVYVSRLPGSPPNFTLTTPELASLKEGWYSYSVEGSIWSPQPHLDSLMSVSGMDTYGNEQALYRTIGADGSVGEAVSLLGGFKGSGWLLPQYNASRVGLQRGGSWMEYFEGPTEPVTLGGKAEFSWGFTGLGTASCAVDGVDISPNGPCTSPLVWPVRKSANQTLTVSFMDVCGVTQNNSIAFGPSFGWEFKQTAVDVDPATTALLTAPKPALVVKSTNAAGAGRRNSVVLLGAGAAAAALLLWML